MAADSDLVVLQKVTDRIVTVRGQRIILDRDLAAMYAVSTSALNRAVKRNAERFPGDFMFQLTSSEQDDLVAQHPQFQNLKFSRVPPHGFTEHGAIMAASLLNSQRAIEASIYVVRAFVQLRQWLATHKELSFKLKELERKLGDHDQAITTVMRAIKQLMEPPPTPSKPKIGFR